MRSLRNLVSLPIHFLLGWGLVLGTLYLVCYAVTPRIEKIGDSYLIFYFHFPSAFDCLLLFIIAGLIAIAQLATSSHRVDLAVASCIEVGLLACTICLVTGMVWADAAWGKPWVWEDKRLLSVAVMWFCYLAYTVFRMNIENPEQRARFSSVMAILFAINVPLVWFAIRIFGKVSHPMNIGLSGEYMRLTQWTGALAFFVLYTAFWRARYRSLWISSEIERLDELLTADRS